MTAAWFPLLDRFELGSAVYIGIGVGVFLFVMFFYLMVGRMRRALGKNPAGLKVGGMSVMTIDAMRKQGLLTDEEADAVRRKMAERELGSMQHEHISERDLAIMREAEINPDAVRKLLTPQELAEIEARRRATQAVGGKTPPGVPTQPAAPAPRPASPQVSPNSLTQSTSQAEPSFVTDPLAEGWVAPRTQTPESPTQAPSPRQQPPQPSMNMTTVVRANDEARAAQASGENKPGELEVLLAKGAISQEEYQRLKQFFIP